MIVPGQLAGGIVTEGDGFEVDGTFGEEESISSPRSTITFYPATVSPAKTVPRVGPTKALDAVMPRRLGPGGQVRIWGMPPAVAYTLAALALGGVGWFAYRELGGSGGRRRHVASNPRRPGSRGGKARRKR